MLCVGHVRRACQRALAAWIALHTASAFGAEAWPLAVPRREGVAAAERFPGARPVSNVAVDDSISFAPEGAGEPLQAFDGDDTTAWRGEATAREWTLTLPFRRPVHVGWVRFLFGDDAARGVPAEYRVEHQLPVDGVCHGWALWATMPHARHLDRDGNQFAYGPSDLHAQRQVLFSDVEACGVRLVITAMSRGAPVVREVRVYEGASPLPVARGDSKVGDERYDTMWRGAGPGPWTLTLALREPAWVDRLRLVVGADSVTVPRDGEPGRRLSARAMPLDYRVETRGDDGAWVPLDEASPPLARVPSVVRELPVRRRLVRFAPRPVRELRVVIPRATGDDGRPSDTATPVVREVALYAADDRRPVLPEPLFISVNANPALAAAAYRGGEAAASGQFARDVHHRLRRIVVGFSSDTRWPADAAIPADDGVGRFLQVVDGDDPTLDVELLAAQAPPPFLLLSGSLDWEFDRVTGTYAPKKGHVRWNAGADAASGDRGMGQLVDVVHGRVAPMLGFCGGAQILALLEAGGGDFDSVLFRNDNSPIREVIARGGVFERAWWSDPPESDADRPTFVFDPRDPLFRFSSDGPARSTTRAFPSSHGDAVRWTAYSRLTRLRELAHTTLCAPWVRAAGPEPTWERGGDRCVHVSQAFRATGGPFPVVGVQFHPEQRDLSRVAPDDPDVARGDALQLMANAVDDVVVAWLASLAR